MGVQSDANGRRFVELTTTVPGTPEEVWAAVATGPGISSWFVPTDIEEREGGAMTFHLGQGLDSTGRVTTWDAPQRLEYEEADWMEGAPPLATELTVEAVDGGECVVRMVHSLFTSAEDWDNQLESMEGGWPSFFQVLRVYLETFKGLPCHSLRFHGESTLTVDHAWRALLSQLGLTDVDGAAKDSPIHSITLDSMPDVGDKVLLAQLASPAPGILQMCAGEWGGRVILAIQLYFYGPEAAEAARAVEPAWDSWLKREFPIGEG